MWLLNGLFKASVKHKPKADLILPFSVRALFTFLTCFPSTSAVSLVGFVSFFIWLSVYLVVFIVCSCIHLFVCLFILYLFIADVSSYCLQFTKLKKLEVH